MLEYVDVLQAGVDPTTALIGIGLSWIAGKLLGKKPVLGTDKPTPLATRGAWIPRNNGGIYPVGPRHCGKGTRTSRKESVEGGKGLFGGGQKQDVFFEPGWHCLAVGPVHALRGIEKGGCFLFTGPITSESHPSGSTVDLGKEGSFRIYWGEENQPKDPLLPSMIGVDSQWPYLCHIVWIERRLGTQPIWGDMRYHLENRPTGNHLDHGTPFILPSQTLDGPLYDIEFGTVADADPDTGYFLLDNDQSSHFIPGMKVYAFSWGGADGDLTVRRSEVVLVPAGTAGDGTQLYVTNTHIYVEEGTLGADGSGTLQTYSVNDDDGANIGHAIADMLFEPSPQGLGRSKDRWNLDSLNEVAIEADTLGIRSSLTCEDGAEVSKVLANALIDHACLLPNNERDATCQFVLLREPSSLDFTFDESHIHGLPQITTLLGSQKVDQLLFSFKDRSRNFDAMTIAVFDDGQAGRADLYKARNVGIDTSVHFESAAQLAALRKAEEMSARASFDIQLQRNARDLRPGMVGTIPGFDEVVRVLSVSINPLNEVVTATVVPDYWGVPVDSVQIADGGGIPMFSRPATDLIADVVEVPEQLLGGFPSTQQVMVLRVRANAQMTGASIHLSRDNTTYSYWGEDSTYQTGGYLLEALASDGPRLLTTGPTFTSLGPDASIAQDFTGDDTSWTLGKQLAVIVSDNGAEICYLKKSSVVSGDTRRLDGLIRARYGTRALDHPIGARVYIVDPTVFTAPDDALLDQNVQLYMKAQPRSNGGQVILDSVVPVGRVLLGAGQAPVKPSYVLANNGGYESGDDLIVSWGLQTGPVSAGAGLQGAGDAVPALDVPGQVEVSLVGTSYVEVIPANTLTHTITSAELVTALGSHVSATVRVRHIANGLMSATQQTLCEAV